MTVLIKHYQYRFYKKVESLRFAVIQFVAYTFTKHNDFQTAVLFFESVKTKLIFKI